MRDTREILLEQQLLLIRTDQPYVTRTDQKQHCPVILPLIPRQRILRVVLRKREPQRALQEGLCVHGGQRRLPVQAPVFDDRRELLGREGQRLYVLDQRVSAGLVQALGVGDDGGVGWGGQGLVVIAAEETLAAGIF